MNCFRLLSYRKTCMNPEAESGLSWRVVAVLNYSKSESSPISGSKCLLDKQ